MAKHDNADCQGFMVPVAVENVPDVELYGELCVPKGRTPSAVQLLVHGTTYNHNYWDWPEDPDMHSHVRAALAAGYATFNVDRLGVPIICGVRPGYIVPRIQALAMNEAARLVEEGVASAAEIDKAIKYGFGVRFAGVGM